MVDGKRKGTAVVVSTSGVQFYEAPKAYSSSQATKVNTPRPKEVKKLEGNDDDHGSGKRKRRRSPSWEREYAQIWKTVTNLGAEQFTGKKKKAFEASKIIERGGRAPKSTKIPYPMLQGIRKKTKERKQRINEFESQADLVTGTPKQRIHKQRSYRGGNGGSSGRVADSSFGPAPSVGMMKSGVLHISRKAVTGSSDGGQRGGDTGASKRRGSWAGRGGSGGRKSGSGR